MMGVNGKAPVTVNINNDGSGSHLAGDDDFTYSSNDLALEWQWNHNPDNKSWSVTEREGYLRLHNNTIASELLHARNTLTMRTEGPACSSVIKMDTKGMKKGDYAGLSAFQLKYGNIGVYVDGSGNKKVYMATNSGSDVPGSKNKIEAEAPMSGDEIYLKVDFKFANVNSDGSSSNNIDKANFYYSFDGDNWKKLGVELSMSYDLKLFTGYRSAIYSYPTQSTGGYVDIDYFDYDRTRYNNADGSYTLGGKTPKVLEEDSDGYYFHDTFENGLGKWTGRGGATVEKSGSKAFEGSSSAYVSGRSSSWQGAVRNLGTEFKAGEEYSFSTNVLYTSGKDSELFHFTIQYEGSDGEVHYDKIASGNVNKDGWSQLANTNYKIPADASGVQIYVESDTATCDFYIDDVIAAPAGTAIKGAGKAPLLTPGDINGDGKIDCFDVILARRASVKGVSNVKGYDADQSGEYEINDLVLINNFVLGRIAEFPVNLPPEPPKQEYSYNANPQYKPAPDSYCKQQPANHGTVVKENYTGINGNKNMYVYLPYGYDKSKKYNVFYLMHGGGESEETCFNDNNINIDVMLDNMIANGEIEPMIVVTPTFNKAPSADGVWEEMRKSIIPYVESKYSTYADDTSIEGLKASRYHRAYGGFSMGGGSTWANFRNNLDIIAYFMPLSGHCWDGAGAVCNAARKSGFKKNEYFVFAATGTKDIAYGNMVPMINELKKNTDVFTYTADFSKGNLYFLEANGNVHWWPQVRHYIYDALPYFFHEGQ
jgi:enterochelin esterase-like enzyme